MRELVELLDAGGVSLHGAAARLGLTEGRAYAALVAGGRASRANAEKALAAVQTWGRVRVVLRAGRAVAEVMCDLGAVRRSGPWWHDEDERVHLHLDVSAVAEAYVCSKAGHATGRTVRTVAFVDAQGEVLFKVMVPKERQDLVAAFNALKEGA